jgi:hypothetical protein
LVSYLNFSTLTAAGWTGVLRAGKFGQRKYTAIAKRTRSAGHPRKKKAV